MSSGATLAARHHRIRAFLLVVAVLAAMCPVGSARADEPDDSTSGTASTVSPSTVAVGGTLTYTLSGFPSGATLQILVDDNVPLRGVPGADPLTTTDGTTSGVVELPEHVAKGVHWLRFEVSTAQDTAGEVRTLDYTNKSPYFTVGDVTIIGGPAVAEGPDEFPVQTAAETPEPSSGGEPGVTQVDISSRGLGDGGSAVEVTTNAFPYAGIVVFASSALFVVLVAVVVVRRRVATWAEAGVPAAPG